MRTLDIEVVLTNVNDAYGYCHSISNREFEIEIDKKLKEMISYLQLHMRWFMSGSMRQNS